MMEDQSQTIGKTQGDPAAATLQAASCPINQEASTSKRRHDEDEDDDNGMTIARRTRSRVTVGDFVLIDNMDFPDVDKRLYQCADSEGDTEYKDFCRHLYGVANESTTDANTEDNDPPYVFNDHIFSPGWSFNLDEELNLGEEQDTTLAPGFSEQNDGLVRYDPAECDRTNLNDNNNQPDVDQEGRNHRIDLCASLRDKNLAVSSLSSAPGFKSPNKHGTRQNDLFNEPEFKRILNHQLRQHIQLLTQTYLLTKNTTNMQHEANEAKDHLVAYLKIFKNKSKPSNLLPAIELVNSYGSSKDIRSCVRLSWRHLPIPETVKTILDSRREIFMYANLLPEVAFSLLPEKLVSKKAKIIFTPNEDKLLAYALNEFKGETSQYAYIASLLMTAKTKMQISNHIKNIKRSPGNEEHPVKIFFSFGQLPQIDLEADAKFRDQLVKQHIDYSPNQHDQPAEHDSPSLDQHDQPISQPKDSPHQHDLPMEPRDHSPEQHDHDHNHNHHYDQNLEQDYDHDYMMNMDLDDLMAASTTISKATNMNTGCTNGGGERNIRNLKLRSSMLELMSNQFSISDELGELIIEDFIKASQTKLSERDHLHLLQLLTDLMRHEAKKPNSEVKLYKQISKFLDRIEAPVEFQERLVLFLNLEKATRCGCAFSYLHWMRFFQFVHHVELHHEGEAFEKKLTRLIDALLKEDPHKVKLAAANLINKHPLLKREFDSLHLNAKPHPSLFLCEEDFDDITEPMTSFFSRDSSDPNGCELVASDTFDHESFELKPTPDEINFASPSCPCICHHHESDGKQDHMELGQHCHKCNLKFMKGRMYLVSKIKPFLAEWSYVNTPPPSEAANSSPAMAAPVDEVKPQSPLWTFEEDKDILEFCRSKAELNDDNISFDAATFEELVNERRISTGAYKKSAREIADRFNQLMEMYRVEGT